MASRNYAQVAPTAATIALNAYIYGYGGHSLVTPHAALKRLWWTDERIDAKITRAFVVSKLRGEEREFLDRPLAFGEGLTDGTYMEWILERAKRLFLILAEIGVPDQIFGCIDDSWDDEDLPLPLENVKSLELSYEDDETLNKKFYDMQFVYLLRELKEGAHIDYGPKEHIPMEHVNTLPPAACLQPYDRVHFPNRPDRVYVRRKFLLIDRDTGQRHGESFIRDMKKARAFPHEHVVPVFATYTSENAGFVLSDFVPEHTLNTFIEHRTPSQFLRIAASERPILLIEWMHCLSDALASLHHRGMVHTLIRPSNIWIDKNNKIAFADVGTIPTLQRNKKSPKTEAYDYAAPEQQITRTPVTLKSSSPPISSMNAFSRLRKMNSIAISDASSSTSGSSGGSSTRSNSICHISTSNTRSNSLSTIRTAFSSTPTANSVPRSPTGTRNFSRHATCPSPTTSMGPVSPTSISSGTSTALLMDIQPETLGNLPVLSSSMSDIYSLACIFLDILTFALKGKNSDFIKFRSSRIIPAAAATATTPQSNKARTDTSFHCSPEKIAAWIDTLEEDSYRHAPHIYRGVPALLGLIRTMLALNAAVRPTALGVRDRIRDILARECGVELPCCAGREWPEMDVSTDHVDGAASTGSPFRRDHLGRDRSSVATAPLASSPKAGDEGGSAWCGTSCGERDSAGRLVEHHVDAERMSVRSSAGASTMTGTRSRRSSARLSSWRRLMRH